METRSRRAFCSGSAAAAALALAAVASSARAETTEEVKIQEDDVQRRVVEARAIGGVPEAAPVQLQLEYSALTVVSRYGSRGYLIGAFDPNSGLYWWTFQALLPEEPPKRLRELPRGLTFWASPQEIVGIEIADAPPSLWILRSTMRVASMEEGRRAALAELTRLRPDIEGGIVPWMLTASLHGRLPMDFYFNMDQPMARNQVRVTSVAREPGGWMIGLAGREGRTAELLLDDHFVVRGAHEPKRGPGE